MTAKIPARIAILAVLAVGMAGCGYNRGDRALSGGAIGAAGGAILGAAAFGNPAVGALVGGAGGAAVGGLTSGRDFNLGRPIWR